jgi:hypothetical protein
VLEILHEFAQRHDGLTRRWVTASEQRWCKPALTHRLGQPRICKKSAATRPRRYDFCHHAITVGDQDGFATSGEADIFADGWGRISSKRIQPDLEKAERGEFDYDSLEHLLLAAEPSGEPKD